jgi:FkbM family methyltransferase
MLEPVRDEMRRIIGSLARRTPHFRGKTRVLRITDRVLGSSSEHGQSHSFRTSVSGVNLQLDTRDVIDFRLLYQGGHDAHIVHLITEKLPRGAVFWDVGANVGSVSLPVARARRDVTLELFEPSPPVAARLRMNLELNEHLAPRINIRSCALSNRTGEADFFISNEKHNSGVGGLTASGNREGSPTKVAVLRGDDLIEANPTIRPSFIKIDVEGYELEVLEGLRRYFETAENVELIFEHEPYRVLERGQERSSTFDYLHSLGFALYRIDPDGEAQPLHHSDLDKHADVYARLDRSSLRRDHVATSRRPDHSG